MPQGQHPITPKTPNFILTGIPRGKVVSTENSEEPRKGAETQGFRLPGLSTWWLMSVGLFRVTCLPLAALRVWKTEEWTTCFLLTVALIGEPSTKSPNGFARGPFHRFDPVVGKAWRRRA
jgi:hypothetical protein